MRCKSRRNDQRSRALPERIVLRASAIIVLRVLGLQQAGFGLECTATGRGCRPAFSTGGGRNDRQSPIFSTTFAEESCAFVNPSPFPAPLPACFFCRSRCRPL